MGDRPSDEELDDESDGIDLLSGMVVVYAAMLGATIAGQVAGIALATWLGSASVGIPVGCSVVLESAVGARLGAAKSGGALTPRQAGRISATYSGALLAFTIPLLGWMDAAHTVGGSPSSWTPARVGLALVLFAFATLARWGLMVLFARRPRR